MKKIKKLIMVGVIVLAAGAASVTAFAASSYNTPAEAAAGLTGKTVEAVIAERYETGKSYGTMANEAGKLEAYKAEMLQIKKDILAEKVAAGLLTQERADEIITAIENNQSSCDGTGMLKNGQRMGAGFGGMQGNGRGGFGQCSGLGQAQ